MSTRSDEAVVALLLGVLMATPALAQSDRPWVDPPSAGDQSSPSPAAPRGGDAAPAPSPPAAEPEPAPAPPIPAPQVRPRQPDETPPQAPSRPRAPEPSPRPNVAPGETAPPPPPAPEPPRTAPPPPARATEQPRPAPGRAAQPDRTPERASSAQVAEQLAIDYLHFWSAPNAVTLDAMPDFYAPRVEFHGRDLSARALFEEKRRFVRRWPDRRYTPRLDTMQTSCDRDAEICTVRTAFDFVAASPERGKTSRGTANLELRVSVAGGRPVIVAETSRVTHRDHGNPSGSLEDDDE